jgi:hypothetical protein
MIPFQKRADSLKESEAKRLYKQLADSWRDMAAQPSAMDGEDARSALTHRDLRIVRDQSELAWRAPMMAHAHLSLHLSDHPHEGPRLGRR